jgi:hypothetical protein
MLGVGRPSWRPSTILNCLKLQPQQQPQTLQVCARALLVSQVMYTAAAIDAMHL